MIAHPKLSPMVSLLSYLHRGHFVIHPMEHFSVHSNGIPAAVVIVRIVSAGNEPSTHIDPSAISSEKVSQRNVKPFEKPFSAERPAKGGP